MGLINDIKLICFCHGNKYLSYYYGNKIMNNDDYFTFYLERKTIEYVDEVVFVSDFYVHMRTSFNWWRVFINFSPVILMNLLVWLVHSFRSCIIQAVISNQQSSFQLPFSTALLYNLQGGVDWYYTRLTGQLPVPAFYERDTAELQCGSGCKCKRECKSKRRCGFCTAPAFNPCVNCATPVCEAHF